jgi:hypothetical protein
VKRRSSVIAVPGGSSSARLLVSLVAVFLLIPADTLLARDVAPGLPGDPPPPGVVRDIGAGTGPGAVGAADAVPLTHLAARVSPAAFTVGDWQLQRLPWRQLRLNGGPPMPVRTVGLQDDQGIPLRRLGPGQDLVYNPTVLAQQGMKRLDAWKQTGNATHLRYARKIADKLDELADEGRRRRWQPHDYPLGGLPAGWVNGNSHGLIQSFLSRYHRLTGAEGRLSDAGLLLGAFDKRKGDRRWFTVVTPQGYVWFEHWPNGRWVHVLNGHLNTLFGLYDYWLETGSPVAERYFLGGALTVRDKLEKFRRKGHLSRYSLSGLEGSLHYHHTHIQQLRLLARMTGDEWFARQAKLLVRDEEVWRANGMPD